MQAISSTIRDLFNGSYPTWGSVPKAQREIYWHFFGMRCVWTEPDIDIAMAWNRASGQSYSEAVYRSKILFGIDKKFAWMEYDELSKLMIYWEQQATKDKALQAQKNRGVTLDKDGKKVKDKKAPCTSTNGPKPMPKDIESFKLGHTIKKKLTKWKKKACDAVAAEAGALEAVFGSDVAEEEGEKVEPEGEVVWINSLSEDIYENYLELLDIKFAETLELKPKPTDQKDSGVWYQAFCLVKLKYLKEARYVELIDEKYKGSESSKPHDTDPKDSALWDVVENTTTLNTKCRIIGVSRTINPRMDLYPVTQKDASYLPVLQKEVELGVSTLSEESQQIKDICKDTQEKLVQQQQQSSILFGRMSEDRAHVEMQCAQDRLLFQQELQNERMKSNLIFQAMASLLPGGVEALPQQVQALIGNGNPDTLGSQHMPTQQVFATSTQLGSQQFPVSSVPAFASGTQFGSQQYHVASMPGIGSVISASVYANSYPSCTVTKPAVWSRFHRFFSTI